MKRAAAKLANTNDFAEKLPGKWNSLIGENSIFAHMTKLQTESTEWALD